MTQINPVELHEQLKEAQELGYCTEALAKTFLRLCKNLSTRPNFNGYSYADDLVQIAAIRCCKTFGSYKLHSVHSPFSYYTRVAWNAMVAEINRQNKHRDLANELLKEQGGYETGYAVPAQFF